MAAFALLWPPAAAAQDLPRVRAVPAFETDLGNTFIEPAMLVEMPGRPGCFAVPEMASGRIWLLVPGDGYYEKILFATVPVNLAERDMGLTGFAFHPDYAANGRYYVKRGLPAFSPRRNVLEEYVAAPDRMHASGNAPRTLLVIDEPSEFRDHNGGAPVFGPDGYLYLGLGDGGWDLATPDPFANGQSLGTLLGKILRIDVNAKDPGLEYAIPPDNPFFAHPEQGVRREIWAYGFRNPYRIAFDRLTRELYAGDVGSDRYEEINLVRKGGNYGWSGKEGDFCFPRGSCDGVEASEAPILALKNGGDSGQAKCIIGGVVYRGDPASPFYGAYLFGDHVLQQIYAFRKDPAGRVAAAQLLAELPAQPIAFTVDSMNRIYVVAFDGMIYRLEHPELKAASSGLRPPALRTPRIPESAGWRRAFALDGRLNASGDLPGAWSVFSPSGTYLGRWTAGARLPGMPGGLVLLRPAP